MPLAYPVPGYYISNVPSVVHECDEQGDHTLCLASGAFTTDPPDGPAEPTDEDPPEGGSSDSEE